MPDNDLTVKISGDSAGAQASLAALRSEVAALEASVKALQGQSKLTASEYQKMLADEARLTTATKQLTEADAIAKATSAEMAKVLAAETKKVAAEAEIAAKIQQRAAAETAAAQKHYFQEIAKDQKQAYTKMQAETAALARSQTAAWAGMAQAARGLGAIVAGAFGIAAAGFVAVTKAGVEMDSQLAGATVSFTALAGSADKAQKLLKDLQQESLRSTAGFKELIPVARILAGAYGPEGLGKVIPTLRAFEDAGAALHSTQSQIETAAIAFERLMSSSGDVARTIRAFGTSFKGFNVGQVLLDAFGSADPKVLKAAGISGQRIGKALLDAMGAEFGGSQAKLLDTVPAMLTKVHDAFRIFAGQITSGFTPQIIEGLKSIRDGFLSLSQNKELIHTLSDAFSTLGHAISEMMKEFGSDENLKSAAKLMKDIFNADNVRTFVTVVKSGFASISASIDGWVKTFEAIKSVVQWIDKHAPGGAGSGPSIMGPSPFGRGASVVPAEDLKGSYEVGVHQGWKTVLKDMAQNMGMKAISEDRPGAVRRGSGTQSLHALGQAIDFAGTKSQMADFFTAIKDQFKGHIRELLYSPLGQVTGNRFDPQIHNPKTRADHFSHVHVALSDEAFQPDGTGWGGRPKAAHLASLEQQKAEKEFAKRISEERVAAMQEGMRKELAEADQSAKAKADKDREEAAAAHVSAAALAALLAADETEHHNERRAIRDRYAKEEQAEAERLWTKNQEIAKAHRAAKKASDREDLAALDAAQRERIRLTKNERQNVEADYVARIAIIARDRDMKKANMPAGLTDAERREHGANLDKAAAVEKGNAAIERAHELAAIDKKQQEEAKRASNELDAQQKAAEAERKRAIAETKQAQLEAFGVAKDDYDLALEGAATLTEGLGLTRDRLAEVKAELAALTESKETHSVINALKREELGLGKEIARLTKEIAKPEEEARKANLEVAEMIAQERHRSSPRTLERGRIENEIAVKNKFASIDDPNMSAQQRAQYEHQTDVFMAAWDHNRERWVVLWREMGKQAKEALQGVGESFFENFLSGAESFKKSFSHLFTDLKSLAIRALSNVLTEGVTDLFKGAFSGIFGTSHQGTHQGHTATGPETAKPIKEQAEGVGGALSDLTGGIRKGGNGFVQSLGSLAELINAITQQSGKKSKHSIFGAIVGAVGGFFASGGNPLAAISGGIAGYQGGAGAGLETAAIGGVTHALGGTGKGGTPPIVNPGGMGIVASAPRALSLNAGMSFPSPRIGNLNHPLLTGGTAAGMPQFAGAGATINITQHVGTVNHQVDMDRATRDLVEMTKREFQTLR